MRIKGNILLALACAVLLFAPAVAGTAAADAGRHVYMNKSLRGEAFTDPSYRFPMPGEWIRKPVKYEAFTGKADIAVTLEQDVYHLILPLIRKYAKEHGLKIAVQEGTCGIYRTYNITTWEGKGVENHRAKRLVEYLLKEVEHLDPKYGFAPASRLRKSGWKFKGDELVGEPR